MTEFGGLLVDFQVAGSPRRVFFDYADPVDPANTFQPPLEPVVASNLRMSFTEANIPLQLMQVGTWQCVALGTSST